MSVNIPTTELAWSTPVGLSCRDRSEVASDLVDAAPPSSTCASDADLLEVFIAAVPGSTAAQVALAQIVERHGTLVYQVALRLVNDRSLADDVFQATFLVLAQSARKIQRSSSLASWLHGTTRNVGRRALAQKSALRSGSDAGVEMVTAIEDDPFSEMVRTHERQLLDEELQRLPEIHRAPLVLHYLEERSHQEISQLLGITVAAVESRLKRAKQELRAKLVRRGITLSVAVAALGAASSVASAAPPAALVSSTITLAAASTAVGTSLTAASASTAIQLAGKELAAMSAASKVTVLVVGAAGTLTIGGAVLFGAVIGGHSGAGSGPGTGPDIEAMQHDAGLGVIENQSPTMLLAQSENPAFEDLSDGSEGTSNEIRQEEVPPVSEDDDSAPNDTSGPAAESSDELEIMNEDDSKEYPGSEKDVESESAESEAGEKDDGPAADGEQPLETETGRQEDQPLEVVSPQTEDATHVKEEMDSSDEKTPEDLEVTEGGQSEKERPDEKVEEMELEDSQPKQEIENEEPAAEMEHPSKDTEGSREEGQPADEGDDNAEPMVASFRQLNPAELQIYRALDQKIELELQDHTFGEVVDYLKQSSGIPIHVDRQGLEEAGLDAEARVNIVLSGITLKSSLALLLENVNGTELDYYVDGEMLFISTEERVNKKKKLRFYDLSGGIENLAQAVESYVNGFESEEPGTVKVTSLGDCLAIETNMKMHKKIEEFITGAKQVAAAREAEGKDLPVVPPPKPSQPEPAAGVLYGGGGFN